MAINANAQDGLDAARRARAGYRGNAWHPLHDAREVEPGIFLLGYTAGTEWRPHAVLRLVPLGPDTVWRAVTWADDPADRQLICYATTLAAAAAEAHRQWIRARGTGVHQGAPIAHWGPDA